MLLNSLIEHSFLEAFEVVYKLISSRGFGNAVTPFLKVKYLCKEKLLDEVKGNYCRSGDRFGYAQALSFLVDGFCQNVSLVKAGKLIEEISELGVVPMEPGCGIWLTNLVQAGDIDAASQFLKSKGP